MQAGVHGAWQGQGGVPQQLSIRPDRSRVRSSLLCRLRVEGFLCKYTGRARLSAAHSSPESQKSIGAQKKAPLHKQSMHVGIPPLVAHRIQSRDDEFSRAIDVYWYTRAAWDACRGWQLLRLPKDTNEMMEGEHKTSWFGWVDQIQPKVAVWSSAATALRQASGAPYSHRVA